MIVRVVEGEGQTKEKKGDRQNKYMESGNIDVDASWGEDAELKPLSH